MKEQELTRIFIEILPMLDNFFFKEFQGVYEQYKLNKTQHKTIIVIGTFNGSHMTEIWKRMGITKGNLSIIIDSLTKLGYVLCERHTDDRRKVSIHLTDSGMKIYEEAISEINENINRKLSAVSKEEKKKFIESISFIYKIAGKFPD
ncbi:MarR family winged helix-turn-helix transcriptional regulator [Spirochaeta isovalerica]|uniref:DNA-binding MarR family transcriptional regulator n=1 Tax=Spirochaeta isovalerica TaxID=150 RepID=A0A841R657_9SPIO|nr:MarR family transcriptional regulator [Spirochaeta isovalerica]MBB6478647.1 DNA-binding MarR family transcriptional regulator [Spirochaeta isovalerica]